MIRTDGAPAERSELVSMVSAIEHRGPDGTGFWSQGPIGLGMARLAIIDVEAGQQPIFNEDGTMAIVCNGEIYNHKAIRCALMKKGHVFRTRTDIEVILHLYEEIGEGCFAELNGMFAVAIAEFERQRVIIARDHFGQKPLYFCREPGFFAFASELKALTALSGYTRRISRQAITSFLNFRFVPAPLSIFEHTEKLMPGSSLSVEVSGTLNRKRYWQINFESNGNHSSDKTYGGTREQLTASVRRHLMSERPLGVFLSGGVDSAALVSCMHDLGHRTIQTYTVGFEGFADNEFENARRIAGTFRTEHQEVTLSAEGFWDSIDPVVHAADEPLADLTTIPLYHLAQRAREDVVVVLSGEGSDELLAGYPSFEAERRHFDRLDSLRPFAPLARQLQRGNFPDVVDRRLDAIANSHANYLARRRYSNTSVFDSEFRKRHGTPLANCGDATAALAAYYQSHPTWHGIHLSLGGMIEWWLPDNLLHKADRMTMAHSIELRCPFLDREFVRHCMTLPLDQRVQCTRRQRGRKIALKEAFASVLPAGIAHQPKKGFSIPCYGWLATVYATRARDELMKPNSLAASLFSANVRGDLMDRAIHGDKVSQHRVWALIILNKWVSVWT